MPTDWQYHGNGVSSGVTTRHGMDGELKSIQVQVDCFKVREWTDEELDEHPGSPSVHWDEEKEVHEQHSDGAHATVSFTVNDGMAEIKSIEPEDEGEVRVRHMPLLRAAERVASQLDGVDEVDRTIDTLTTAYEQAEGIHIDQLDG